MDLLEPISPEEIKERYRLLSAEWVSMGIFHHTALVRVDDLASQSALADLGFGREQSYGARRTARIEIDPRVRPAREEDLESILLLTPLIAQANVAAPVFAQLPAGFIDQLADAHRREFRSEHATYLVAEMESHIAGFAMITHAGFHPLWPDPTAELTVAAVAPEFRGHGLGTALALAAINWAFDSGHTTMSTDWRTANQFAAITWSKVGFNITGWRMARQIPIEATSELQQ